ncbi:MAG: CoA ester lyase, partial [Gammaproteobacteria bacterium]|nr:CoA ester lyase [Gammaproteobacteria bacterium]
MIEKAAASGVDHVFLDLEDACAPNRKVAARRNIVEAFNELDWGRTVRCVRINDTGTRWCHGDVIEVVEGARENLDVIMLPKPYDAADVLFVDKLLHQLELDLGLGKKIGLELLIEETLGLQNIEAIANSTPRLEAMIFGMGDYTASQGMDLTLMSGENRYPGDIFHYAKFRVAMTARARGIDAIDGPYGAIRNTDGYRASCLQARALGMVGKWALHPSQIEHAQDVFTPEAGRVEEARRLTAAYREAEAKGEGAV